MGPEIHPDVRAAFEALRDEPELTLELDAERGEDALHITSRVDGDPGGVARRVRVHGRGEGEEWLEGEGSLVVPAASDVSVRYYAELVGTGGAVLVTRGSISNPLVDEGGERGGGGGGDDGGAASDDDGAFPILPVLLVAGGVIAVAAIVVVIVAVSSGGQSSDTQFGSPMVVRL
jgi:hypothetical protein